VHPRFSGDGTGGMTNAGGVTAIGRAQQRCGSEGESDGQVPLRITNFAETWSPRFQPIVAQTLPEERAMKPAVPRQFGSDVRGERCARRRSDSEAGHHDGPE